MNSKTLEAQSIPIPPQLTGLLKQALGRSGTGFDEGAFLQQLHYWSTNPKAAGWIVDGVKWIYNSLKAWMAQFPWMSEYALRKAIANLKKLGLIHTQQHGLSQCRRVMFYRIDYERLYAFADGVCDLITPRHATGDRIEVWTDHTSYTKTTSETSLSEQQHSVVAEESVEDSDPCMSGDPSLEVDPVNAEGEPTATEPDTLSAPGSGKISDAQAEMFPELIDAVARAIALPPSTALPLSLRRAIALFPERVLGAIDYLKHQQQKRQIQNPMGYLHGAIVGGWNLSSSPGSNSALPVGFTQWFEQAKAQGQVIAATTINGVHHTLHVEKGWVPTQELMQC